MDFVGSSLGSATKRIRGALTSPSADLGLYPQRLHQSIQLQGICQHGQVSGRHYLFSELASAGVKKEPRLQGPYQNEFVALEATVKDSKRVSRRSGRTSALRARWKSGQQSTTLSGEIAAGLATIRRRRRTMCLRSSIRYCGQSRRCIRSTVKFGHLCRQLGPCRPSQGRWEGS